MGDLIVSADEQPATSRELFAPIRQRWIRGSTATLKVIPVPSEQGSAPARGPKKIDITLIGYAELYPLLGDSTVDE